MVRSLVVRSLAGGAFVVMLAACGGSSIPSVSPSQTVAVASAAPTILSFTADPIVVEEGQSVDLSWTIDDPGASLRLGPSQRLVQGTGTSESPSVTTTYTLAATNLMGTTYASVTVAVTPSGSVAPTETEPPQTAISWVDSAGNLVGLSSECGNLSGMFTRTNGQVITSVALQGLWTLEPGSRDRWGKIGVGPGSDPITNRGTAIVDDPSHPDTFWQSGIYNAGGVYRTDDGGNTFRQLGDVEHSDLVSIDFTDPDRRTLLSGVHEQPVLFRSTDGGATWTNVSAGLPRNVGYAAAPLVLDRNTFLLGSWSGSESGIYRSTDAGETWEAVFETGVRGQPLVVPSTDGGPPTIFWLLEGGLGVVRSTDAGLTWEARGRGPSANESASLHQLPDGRLVALAGQQLITSADEGATWAKIGPPLPYQPNGFIYSSALNAFYAWRFDCVFDSTNLVPPDAVVRLDVVASLGGDAEAAGEAPAATTTDA